jgi:hypothetical protein
VGGADAYMIIGDVLLEVKASANATIRREDFYQVIGYVLLDSDECLANRASWQCIWRGSATW